MYQQSTGNLDSTADPGRTDVPRQPEIAFPQTGWHRLELYAAALDMSRKALLNALNKHKVPRRRIGDRTLIRVEDLLESLPQSGAADEETPKARKRKR